MNLQEPSRISVIDPISPAIERAKLLLFKPFDISKWFIIGFCAWLAQLGQGGFNFNFNFPHRRTQDFPQPFHHIKDFVIDNLPWIILSVIIVFILAIAVGLVLTWLNSRGKFMFLHCVAGNKAEVKIPWQKFRKHGNSLFLFRIVLGIISFVIVGVPVLGIVLLIITMVTGTVPNAASIPGIVIFGLIIFALLIALFLVKKFTLDFVVPIMFLQTASCVAGWREFLTILSVNKARFALYILFQIVIAIAIGAIISIGFCIGCCLCCASLLLFIPYIGTVILLPLLVFKRAYSLFYLRQFGPGFDVFSSARET